MKRLARAAGSILSILLASATPLGALAAPDAGKVAEHLQAPAARAGAPNILVWMLDDVGFAQLGSFGGPIETPNIDRVARMGLRYSNYHTAPICSASRAAMLTGRNPHTVHIGAHAGSWRDDPGYDTRIPPSAGTIGENLRQAGYVTYALGKWDHIAAPDVTPAGPYSLWPERQGFDRFYGFLAADTDNWAPTLWAGSTPVTPPPGPQYHLNRDLADQAIAMIETRSARHPTPPFMMYWATGTAHAPHHAPREWIERYRGRFDAGWDVARAEILKRQIKLKVAPASAKLPPRPEGMPAWASLTKDEQRLYARQMEVMAASLSHADAEFGRILDALQARGELDNTIVVITSDNGASAEGGPSGAFNEMTFANGDTPNATENLRWYDQWGGPSTYPHYALGWAVAGTTPYRYYKQTTYEGGIRVPLVVAWPDGISARGEWRDQFTYVADLAPTLLDAAGVKAAAIVNGVTQSAFDGSSFVSTFKSAATPGPSRAQYFEFNGNKAIWADEWKALTAHRLRAWDMSPKPGINEPWKLYNLKNDPGETQDLAARHPEKVAELDRLFHEQAAKYNVEPIAEFTASTLFMMKLAKEEFIERKGRWTYSGPVARISQINAPPIAHQSFRMTADLSLATGRETGPIFALGGDLGGMALYLKDGAPAFMARDLAGKAVRVAAPTSLAPGGSSLELKLERLAGDAIRVTLLSNGRVLNSQESSIRIPRALLISETFDIGRDDGRLVSNDYSTTHVFPGKLSEVSFDFSQGM